jgi:DNA-binding MarR family transcriptional regulator
MDDKKTKRSAAASVRMPSSWKEPSGDGADLALVSFPTFLLQRATALFLRDKMRPVLALHGLGVAEYRILAFLDHFGEVTSAQVREGSSMDKGQISRAVDALVARGLVQRKSDPSHGKRYWLHITKSGKKTFDTTMVSVRQLQANILATLNQAERQGLYSALTKLSRPTSLEKSGGDTEV